MRLTKRVKGTAAGLIMGAGVGAGFGAFCYGAESWTDIHETPQEAQERLSRAEERATAAPQNLLAVEQGIGEACLSVMNSYRYGEALDYVGEDTAVSDLITNAAQPCGNNPTNIRTDIVELRTADEAVVVAPGDVETAKINLAEAEANHSTGEIQDYMLYVGLTGGVFGALAGNWLSREENDS